MVSRAVPEQGDKLVLILCTLCQSTIMEHHETELCYTDVVYKIVSMILDSIPN